MRPSGLSLPFAVSVFALFLSACNLPSGQATTAAPTQAEVSPATSVPRRTATPTPSPTATPVPAPSDTPTAIASATPSLPMVTPKDKDVACYLGPGTVYSVEGALLAGDKVPVVGVNADGTWWAITNPRRPANRCWVLATATTFEGDRSAVAVLAAPIAFVENVSVTMTPPSANITCGTFPYTFDVQFSITVNGPTTVTFQRRKSNGEVGPLETVSFASAGTQEFSDYYRVGEVGAHKFLVHVTLPNDMSGEATVMMACSP